MQGALIAAPLLPQASVLFIVLALAEVKLS